MIVFAVSVDEMSQQGTDAEIVSDENTLGFWLDLYARYSQNVKVIIHDCNLFVFICVHASTV